ncbi:MAG: hypothetical protein J6W96_01480 [Alphaproteobacteria bacterium]|nr:hypothetical protein [Alphaproteobacteria bacterium]
MTENTLKQTENRLKKLKSNVNNKIWKYVILKEFIELFGEDSQVINFISSTYNAVAYGILDDTKLLSKEELNIYGKNQEISLEEKLSLLLEME